MPRRWSISSGPRCTDLYHAGWPELVADSSKLKAAVATGDPPTVQPFADEYLKRCRTPTCSSSPTAAAACSHPPATAHRPSIRRKARGSVDEFSRVIPHDRGLLQVVSVPIFVDGPTARRARPPHRRASSWTTTWRAQLAGGHRQRNRLRRRRPGPRVVAARRGKRLAWPASMNATGITHVTFNDEEFLALSRPIASIGGAPQGARIRSS